MTQIPCLGSAFISAYAGGETSTWLRNGQGLEAGDDVGIEFSEWWKRKTRIGWFQPHLGNGLGNA